jgi:hypothetical protein
MICYYCSAGVPASDGAAVDPAVPMFLLSLASLDFLSLCVSLPCADHPFVTGVPDGNESHRFRWLLFLLLASLAGASFPNISGSLLLASLL